MHSIHNTNHIGGKFIMLIILYPIDRFTSTCKRHCMYHDPHAGVYILVHTAFVWGGHSMWYCPKIDDPLCWDVGL